MPNTSKCAGWRLEENKLCGCTIKKKQYRPSLENRAKVVPCRPENGNRDQLRASRIKSACCSPLNKSVPFASVRIASSACVTRRKRASAATSASRPPVSHALRASDICRLSSIEKGACRGDEYGL